tara:strand:- start:225 stop:476 length:252 start_codon:yes stop_codon:yes gene_type:complete
MKYVLVNKFDEIVDKVELDGNVGKTGATTYFQGLKRIPDQKEFNKLWKVMSELEYDSKFKLSLQNKQYEWWKEEGDYLDIEKS